MTEARDYYKEKYECLKDKCFTPSNKEEDDVQNDYLNDLV